MRTISYVVHVKTPGTSGGETRSYQVAQALAAIGLDVHLYGQLKRSFSWHDKVHPHQLKTPTPFGLIQLLHDFSKFNVSVVIERYQFPPFNVGFLAQQTRRGPTILEVHGIPIDEYASLSQELPHRTSLLTGTLMKMPRSLWEKLQAAIFRHASHLIVTSSGTKNIFENLGVPPEKISVVYNSVDPVLFNPSDRETTTSRRMLGLPPDSQIVLYAGSFFHEELTIIIEAIPTIAKMFPAIRFVFIGTGPTNALSDRAQKLGLSGKHFIILPTIEHSRMPDLLSAVDVVLAPYSLASQRFKLGFHYSPLKIMEALAMEKAVVTVNAHELVDILNKLPNVHFVESGSTDSWKEGICKALEFSQSTSLQEGRTFVMDGYRWQDAAKKYLEIIRSIE